MDVGRERSGEWRWGTELRKKGEGKGREKGRERAGREGQPSEQKLWLVVSHTLLQLDLSACCSQPKCLVYSQTCSDRSSFHYQYELNSVQSGSLMVQHLWLWRFDQEVVSLISWRSCYHVTTLNDVPLSPSSFVPAKEHWAVITCSQLRRSCVTLAMPHSHRLSGLSSYGLNERWDDHPASPTPLQVRHTLPF